MVDVLEEEKEEEESGADEEEIPREETATEIEEY